MSLRPRSIASAAVLPVLLAAFSRPASAGDEPPTTTLAQQLNASYRSIRTISCEIRKTVTADDRTERWLSRVHYQSPNMIHVDNVAPLKRRIISDGTNLHYHVAGRARGFSSPISDLPEPMLSTSRNVPATPVEHLLRIQDCPEKALPGTEELPVRRSYSAAGLTVILSCDPDGRLVHVDFFKTPAAKELVARYTYSSFVKSAGGAWVPCRHRAELFLANGEKVTETRRIDNLVLDKPVAAALFDHSIFFRGVEFVNDFNKARE